MLGTKLRTILTKFTLKENLQKQKQLNSLVANAVMKHMRPPPPHTPKKKQREVHTAFYLALLKIGQSHINSLFI